jgi:pimeloyl-ACP methyl ester carboxylesterase
MTHVVLVHGAFRGGWAWDFVTPLITGEGVTVVAPTLTGCTPGSDRVGTHVRLNDWIADVTAAAEQADPDEPLILVGHSQGGLVTTAAAAALTRPVTLMHLDAPVPENGERGIDLNPPGVPAPPANLDPALWIPARPVGPDEGFVDDDLRNFVNARLVPTPVGPSLDPVTIPVDHRPRQHYVFCSRTPSTFPCWSTRLRLEERGTDFVVLDSHHDAPLLRPELVAAAIGDLMTEERADRR